MSNFNKISVGIINDVINTIEKENEISLNGFSNGEISFLLKNFVEQKNEKSIIIAPDLITASRIENMLDSFAVKSEILNENFNYYEINSEKNKKISLEIAKKINNFLYKNDALIILPNCLNINSKKIEKNAFKIKLNDEINREKLLKNLVDLGFTRVVEDPQDVEFVLLGDILRLKANNDEIVVEFFGDFVEKIVVNNSPYDEINICDFDYKFNQENYNLIVNFSSFINNIFIINPRQIEDEIFYLDVEETNNKINRTKLFDKSNFLSKIKECFENKIYFNEFFEFNTKCNFQNQIVGARKYLYDYNSLLSDLKYYKENNFNVVLFCGSEDSKRSILSFLSKNLYVSDFDAKAKLDRISISSLNIPLSFSFLQDQFVFIGTDDLVKNNKKVQKMITKKSIYLPKIGDYVVHELHGIGKCIQIERMKILGHEKDYVVVEYRGGDKLYVPSEQLNLLTAYIGSEEQPKLNLIGGVEFGRQKEKVKNSIRKMTINLLELYAEREKKKGFVYEKNNYLYDEFVKSFPYEATQDQVKAEKEIISDMESDKILDRLICGDVGYGKTEVAMRAMFKAVMSGKQVAFLCPTTVLSEQHYHTCLERFKDFMVNVEVLNRFKSSKAEVDNILKRLKEGKIDILCGTHRILAKDIEFKDLSLLVLDEEQKFGVEHKEKIKQLKSNIDILSMSATPIPRTLQMSLSGIRDISLIETPPKNRLPVQTYVTEFDEKLLVDACKKELNRNGQVFIIYNEIKTIDIFAAKVRELLGDAKIGIAHAAMNEKLLQDNIKKMYNQEFDIIIATTLIENGVDNPKANTLIVIDSDKLGLSELYQLRGRVGRSDRLAYAYFTYKPQKVLTEAAYKRLEALAQFTELGSGFKIAMRDLEIRGAGDLLGKEQHGHLTKVGFDLYNKLINETIEELKGNVKTKLADIKLEIDLDAFIKQTYISEESERIEIYSQISELSVEKAEKLKENLKNNYGEIPVEVSNLIKIGLLKNLAQQNFVLKIILNSKIRKFILYKKEEIVSEKIANSLKNYKDFVSLKFDKNPEIIFENNLDNAEMLDFMIKFLI